jgi:two-component system, response regulator YesN
MKVLVLDDDQSLVKMAREWLTLAGHEVVALSDFNAAQNYLSFNQPDALITDVRLGAFNGMQLLLFAKLEHPDMVAIAMTGFDDPSLRQEAARIGAIFLVKPVTGRDLEHAIEGRARPIRATYSPRPDTH